MIQLVTSTLPPASPAPAFDRMGLERALAELPAGAKYPQLVKVAEQQFPGCVFRIALEKRGYYDGRILAADGSELSADPRAWLRLQLAAHDQHPRKTRENCKTLGIRRTSIGADRLYLVGHYGRDPQDFFQLEIERCTERPASSPFGDEWYNPSVSELLDSSSPDENHPPIGPPVYRFADFHNIAEFLQREAAQHRADSSERLARFARAVVVTVDPADGTQTTQPAYEAKPDVSRTPGPSRLQRLFTDWAESTAGTSGACFCDHWALELYEGEVNGVKECSAVPAWTTHKALPDLQKANIQTVPALVEWLEQFDVKAGHPFAWYFYALHGNRISGNATVEIAQAIEGGLHWLGPADRAVLARFAAEPYGF